MKYNNKPVKLTFKKLVALISEAETFSDINEVFALIDWNFQQGTITWSDHEVLWEIAEKIDDASRKCWELK